MTACQGDSAKASQCPQLRRESPLPPLQPSAAWRVQRKPSKPPIHAATCYVATILAADSVVGAPAQRKPRKRRAEAEVHALTQEELLVEAAETELVNTASLARLIAVEEEVWLSARLRNLGPVSPLPCPVRCLRKGA